MYKFTDLVAQGKPYGFIIERENRVIGGEYIRYSLNDNKGMEYECRTLSELAQSLAEAIALSEMLCVR